MRDRSSEFFSTAEVIRQQTIASGAPPVPAAKLPARSSLYRSSHSLTLAVKEAGYKAERLSRLAARRGLFDDPAAEVNALSASLKADLQSVDGALRLFLSEAVRQRDGAGVALALSAAGGGQSSSSSARAFWLAVGDVLKEHALGVTRVFHSALRARGESMKAAAAQRSHYARSTWAPSAAALDSPLFTGPPSGGPPPGAVPPTATVFAPGLGRPPGTAGMGGPPQPYNRFAPQAPIGRPSHGGGVALAGVGASATTTALGSLAAPGPEGLRRRPGQQTPLPGAITSAGGPLAPSPSKLPHPHPHGVSGSGGAATSVSIGAAHGDSGTGGLGGGRVSAYAPRYPAGAYAYSAAQVTAYRSGQARADEMRGVEATLSELGHMFSRLAGLVAEQGETVERIDSDMEAALDNVTEGHAQLLTYFQSASRNRGLILKVLAVMAAVVLLFAAVR